jgi:hypothetical protein
MGLAQAEGPRQNLGICNSSQDQGMGRLCAKLSNGYCQETVLYGRKVGLWNPQGLLPLAMRGKASGYRQGLYSR